MLIRTRTTCQWMAGFHFSSAVFCRLTALVALMLALASPVWAARHALVIGNASYAERPLKNPVNDATDLAKALEGAGFKVTLRTNLSGDAMKEAIGEFGDALRRSPDNTGLFYFSGHGVQTPKGNYLLPVGRAFKRTKDVELFAVEARAVLAEMQAARNLLNILILDACRDSPLPSEEKSAGGDARGLAPMTAPSGSLIAFAAAPGKTASDNSTERNGLYTKHLIDAINTPGLRLEDVFKRVGARVEKESTQKGAEQSPEEVSKLRSEVPFYFRAGASDQLGTTQRDSEQDAWVLAKRSDTVASYDAYLTAYPVGRFVSEARDARAALHRDEDQAWERCDTGKDILACNRYLERYPNGRFVQQGQARLDDVRKQQQTRLPSLTPPVLIDGRFEILNNGAEVRDLKTKLIWQRCEIGQQWDGHTCSGKSELFTFENAQRQTGDVWKVPKIRALESLLTGVSTNKRHINSKVFMNTSPMVWSSTVNSVNPEFAWAVFFGGGVASDGVSPRYKHAVRLVRVDE